MHRLSTDFYERLIATVSKKDEEALRLYVSTLKGRDREVLAEMAAEWHKLEFMFSKPSFNETMGLIDNMLAGGEEEE